MLIVPVLTFVTVFAWIIVWTVIMLFLWSCGTIEGGLATGFTKKVTWDKQTYAFVYIHAFALLWIIAMILAIGQFIIIVTVCVWYFSHGTDRQGSGGMMKAIWWTFRYHLGSLAFGSLILAIVWAI